jgi:hypothetical protein
MSSREYWSTNFLTLTPPVLLQYDLSGVLYKSRDEIVKMREAWNSFEQITVSNLQTSTLIGIGAINIAPSSGDTNSPYHFFETMASRNKFLRGQMLHIERYPYINFSTLSTRPELGTNAVSGLDINSQVTTNDVLKASEITNERKELANFVRVSTLQASTNTQKKPYFRSHQDYISYLKGAIRINEIAR